MYEVIYNRIISNLLLWVPSAPNNNTAKPQIKVAANNPLLNINMTESISIPFSMAKSNIIFGNKYHYLLLMKSKSYFFNFFKQIRVPPPILIQIQIQKISSIRHTMKVSVFNQNRHLLRSHKAVHVRFGLISTKGYLLHILQFG